MATYQSMKIASDAKSVEEKRHQERKKALCVPFHHTMHIPSPALLDPSSSNPNTQGAKRIEFLALDPMPQDPPPPVPHPEPHNTHNASCPARTPQDRADDTPPVRQRVSRVGGAATDRVEDQSIRRGCR